MSVARTHHTSDYTVMSNYHFKDKNISLKAKGLLSLMLSLPDEWDYSVTGLASLSSDGETSVRTAVKELEEHNYLTRTPVRENGRIVDWEYDIYEKPLELLQVENQQVESPLQENKDNKILKQSNTKESNINNSKELLQDFQFGKSKPKKDDLFTKCLALIDSYDFSSKSNIRQLLIDYLRYRLTIKDKPLYANMWKGMLNKLSEMCGDDIQMYKDVIQQSIERGYLSFYPISSYSKNTDVRKSIEQLPPGQAMTPEDYEELARITEERKRLGLRTEF